MACGKNNRKREDDVCRREFAGLREFAGDGKEQKDKIYAKVVQQIAEEAEDRPPVSRRGFSISRRKWITAAAVLVFSLSVMLNADVLADSIRQFVRSFSVNEQTQIQEMAVDYVANIDAARSNTDPNSLEYQIFTKPVENPGYLYLFYYRGYQKALVLDADTDNLDEVEDWLCENVGIVARAADTPEEISAYLNENIDTPFIRYSEIRSVMGPSCLLPEYLPILGDWGNIIVQHNERNRSVSITYFFGIEDGEFLSLSIEDQENGVDFLTNIAVTESIQMDTIGEWDVYHAGGYYVWECEGLRYVMYSEYLSGEECVKIIENMK